MLIPPVTEHLPPAYGLPAVDVFRTVFTGGIYVSERPWYRRPNSVDRISVPNTYYRISVLEKIRITLLEVGGYELVDTFKEGPCV
ncbi:hypothetical protein OROGR_019436 [Orobanche gracilis]